MTKLPFPSVPGLSTDFSCDDAGLELKLTMDATKQVRAKTDRTVDFNIMAMDNRWKERSWEMESEWTNPASE